MSAIAKIVLQQGISLSQHDPDEFNEAKSLGAPVHAIERAM
jgi:hypothetical protein